MLFHLSVCSSEFSSLDFNIRNLLRSNCNFEVKLVKFIRHQANMIAHSLTKAAISRQMFDFVSPCIQHCLNDELSYFCSNKK